jgi:chromosome partitioning protein
MPLVIAIAHQKGGVGKTTLAANLHSWFGEAGYRCALVDIDPQGSLSHLLAAFGNREEVSLIRRGDFQTYDALAKRLEPFDVAVIDTPPYLSRELVDVLSIAHAAIVPCKASPLDVLAARQTMEYIEEIRRTRNPSLASAVVLTMVIAGTEFTSQIREHLASSGLKVLRAQIGNRVAYARALLKGNSVKAEDGGKAWAEIDALGQEIVRFLSEARS